MTRERSHAQTQPEKVIDLEIPWLWQYAPDVSLFDPTLGDTIRPRLSQLDGYLTGTSAAFVSLSLEHLAPSLVADPWRAWSELLARTEAEFCGRIFSGPADQARWLEDPSQLCWGVPRIEGLRSALQSTRDLDRLRSFLDRGVRVFGWSSSRHAGASNASTPGGLIELLGWLERKHHQIGVKTAVDLSHTSRPELEGALDWFEADPARSDRVIPLISRCNDFPGPAPSLSTQEIRRWRAIGAYLGFALITVSPTAPAALLAEIALAAQSAWKGEPGCKGLAISTSFLRADARVAELGEIGQVARWLLDSFGPDDGAWLATESARALLHQMFDSTSGG
jgi:hypothetical protein